MVALSSFALLASQSQSEDQKLVQVTFDNTTSSSVDIFGKDPDGSEKLVAKKLPANKAVEMSLFPGNQLLVKRDGKALAEYQVDDNARQLVDVSELISWQSPVKLTFVNDTKQSVDIYYLDDDSKEIPYIQDLRAMQQLMQSCYPSSRWVI
jgi:hypothetical protein